MTSSNSNSISIPNSVSLPSIPQYQSPPSSLSSSPTHLGFSQTGVPETSPYSVSPSPSSPRSVIASPSSPRSRSPNLKRRSLILLNRRSKLDLITSSPTALNLSPGSSRSSSEKNLIHQVSGLLIIHLLSCRGLRSRKTRTRNPYVRIEFDKTSFKSRVAKKTLDPLYGQQFTFYSSPGSKGELWITVWDHNMLRDFLGYLAIPIEVLPVGETLSQWYPINDRPDRKIPRPCGQVHLSICYIKAAVPPSVSPREKLAPFLASDPLPSPGRSRSATVGSLDTIHQTSNVVHVENPSPPNLSRSISGNLSEKDHSSELELDSSHSIIEDSHEDDAEQDEEDDQEEEEDEEETIGDEKKEQIDPSISDRILKRVRKIQQHERK